MSDLIQRLRGMIPSGDGYNDPYFDPVYEAIDRIEALENTLRQAREALKSCHGFVVSDYEGVAGRDYSNGAIKQGDEALAAIDAVLPGAPPSELSDERILEIAHRKAWRYKHSSNTHHSDTYKFNRMCMIEFARAVLKEGKG